MIQRKLVRDKIKDISTKQNTKFYTCANSDEVVRAHLLHKLEEERMEFVEAILYNPKNVVEEAADIIEVLIGTVVHKLGSDRDSILPEIMLKLHEKYLERGGFEHYWIMEQENEE